MMRTSVPSEVPPPAKLRSALWLFVLPVLLLGGEVALSQNPPSAAPLVRSSAAPAYPTYTRDIAPILNKNCVGCHRTGEVGPFPLGSYADAKKRARMIEAVTQSRAMPPWKPDPNHGEFRDERRLTKIEITTLARWVRQSTPRGDIRDLPLPPKFPVGWQLGRPDMVLKMPAPFPIPAEGRDVYQRFVFPLNLTRERHLVGLEVRPGNRRVTHHAVGILDGSGTARKRDAQTPEQGYGGMGVGFIPIGLTPGYVPGQTVRRFDEEVSLTLKPKTDFVLEMHYHPIGKPETDQTEVGLYFTETKPKHAATGVLLASEEIDIPAGARDYRIQDSFKLPVDFRVTSIWAHLHMIGKATRVWADLPDGSRRPLLSISDWDFNWQDTYLYKEPIRLPKGTVIHAEWVYDNTAANVHNPNSPPKRVLLGEGSTDEMSGLWIGGTADNWQGELGLLAANIGHYFEIRGKGDPYRARAEKARE